MNKRELEELKIQVMDISEKLYQNRSEGMQEMVGLLPMIQAAGSVCTALNAAGQLQVIQILQKLLTGYQAADVLLLADTLVCDVMGLVDFCLIEGE